MYDSRLRTGWGLSVETTEANARPRMFFDTAKETDALRTREDTSRGLVWVLYETREERDDAFHAFADYFRTTRRGESPFDYE